MSEDPINPITGQDIAQYRETLRWSYIGGGIGWLAGFVLAYRSDAGIWGYLWRIIVFGIAGSVAGSVFGAVKSTISPPR